MKYRDQRAPVWVIWGLVGLFGVVEAAAWTIAGGIPQQRWELIEVGTAWFVMIILASLARRLHSQAQQIQGYEHSQQETLGEIEQLQTQNAMLEIIARSVDVTLAFQGLASRIARLVPCDRVGLALLTDDGPGIPDLHRARARGRAPHAPASRCRLQGRSDDPRERRPVA
jgi:hypothetical protein